MQRGYLNSKKKVTLIKKLIIAIGLICLCLMILSCSCRRPENESKKVITCYDDIMNKPTATTEELGLCLIEYRQNY